MKLFAKKYPPKNEMKIVEKWAIATGRMNNSLMFIRFNQGLREIAGHPDYPFQVGIAIPLEDMNEHGMPTRLEQKLFNDIENKIFDELAGDNELLLANILTFPGVREFSLYAGDPKLVEARFMELRNSISSHELQLSIQVDKDWKVYKGFPPK